jgi:hypothetical protein
MDRSRAPHEKARRTDGKLSAILTPVIIYCRPVRTRDVLSYSSSRAYHKYDTRLHIIPTMRLFYDRGGGGFPPL